MGILTEPVTGWRVYDVAMPGLLTSMGTIIMPKERAVSYCRGNMITHKKCRLGPEQDCTCGFYAFKTKEHLFASTYMQHGAIAEVYMWGTVHEYGVGWRAQFTYPKKLWMYGDRAETIMLRVARDYLVPVKLFSLEWPKAYKAVEAKRVRMWSGRDQPKTEKELMDLVKAGDAEALKTMKARLASAVCTRKKAVVRQEKDLIETKKSLEVKQKQLAKLRRIKL